MVSAERGRADSGRSHDRCLSGSQRPATNYGAAHRPRAAVHPIRCRPISMRRRRRRFPRRPSLTADNLINAQRAYDRPGARRNPTCNCPRLNGKITRGTVGTSARRRIGDYIGSVPTADFCTSIDHARQPASPLDQQVVFGCKCGQRANRVVGATSSEGLSCNSVSPSRSNGPAAVNRRSALVHAVKARCCEGISYEGRTHRSGGGFR